MMKQLVNQSGIKSNTPQPAIFQIDTNENTVIVVALPKYTTILYYQLVNYCRKFPPGVFGSVISYDSEQEEPETAIQVSMDDIGSLPMYSLFDTSILQDLHCYKFRHETGTNILIFVTNRDCGPSLSLITCYLIKHQDCKYFGMVSYDNNKESPDVSFQRAKNNIESIPLIMNRVAE